jgi:hypothetical protein
MAAMIAENSYLIPDDVKRDYAKQNVSLITVEDLSSKMGNDEDGDDHETIKLLD